MPVFLWKMRTLTLDKRFSFHEVKVFSIENKPRNEDYRCYHLYLHSIEAREDKGTVPFSSLDRREEIFCELR